MVPDATPSTRAGREAGATADRFLQGRAVWITGGVTGIGRACAVAFADAGADVAIGSLPGSASLGGASYSTLPSEAEMTQAKADIERRGVRCFLAALDLRSDASVDAFHHGAVAALGPLDILVNAAGVCAQELITVAEDATWATVLDINLNGPYRTTKRCLPTMLERRWGRVINIGSTAAEVGFARHGAYCASKHGLLGLTRCVALEGAAHGVTCNAINPGTVATGLTRIGSSLRVQQQGGEGRDIEENLQLIAQRYPQKRLIEAGEVAAISLFLCREEACHLTGEALTVSGGALW